MLMSFLSPSLRVSVALLICGAALQMVGQEPKQVDGPPAKVEEPRLIPTEIPLTPTEKCKNAQHDSFNAWLVIDEEGVPQKVRLLNPQNTDEDGFALQAVQQDHFVPARRGGVAIGVTRMITVDLDECVERVKDSDGHKVVRLRLAALPKQTLQPPLTGAELSSANDAESSAFRVGGDVSAPVPVSTPAAIYTDEARRKDIQGVCMIRLIVDSRGMPQSPRVVRPLGFGLDQKAIEAVLHYRFRPAIKKGVGPVPVVITIAVNFRLF
jgi:TonB family protein